MESFGMRKPKRASGLSSGRKLPASSVAEYLARVPEPARGTLKKIRSVIRSVVPAEATETISYGMPSFQFKGWLVGYAAFADHCSFFPGALPKEFAREVKRFPTSKGTIRFPVDKPLPSTLIKKLVKARLAQKIKKKQKTRRRRS
jgi:uncharacterized protein YdhG (YjbR/CyaY superfamily)